MDMELLHVTLKKAPKTTPNSTECEDMTSVDLRFGQGLPSCRSPRCLRKSGVAISHVRDGIAKFAAHRGT
ncbi:hypothetical protein BDI4_300060 [Burkholderia diffusa]|nr:hypothetical protein BDI4_300060 [Burkholderia diffusa]